MGKPFPHCPPVYFHEWLWSNQHTLPLLFDDCMTILEKLQALWYKLNELIDDYNRFKDDFAKWKEEVEQTLESLQLQINEINNRLDKIEQDIADIKQDIQNIKNTISQIQQDINNIKQDISDIKQSITNLGDQISNLQSQITNLLNRVTNIEKTLADLNIVVPQELFDENNNAWFVSNVSAPYLAAIGQSSNWTAVQKLYEADILPAVSFKVGYLGFPIVYAKLPFIFRRSGTISSNTSKIVALLQAMYNRALNATPFVPITLATAPTFEITDQFKFPASYLMTSVQTGTPYRTELNGGDLFQTRNTSTELSVRVQLTRNSTAADIIVGGAPIVYEADGYTYLSYIGEHQ